MKDNNVFIAIIVVLILAFVALLYFVKSNNQPVVVGPIEGITTFSDLARGHTEEPVTYPTLPPTGGDHHPVWIACDTRIYDSAIPNEKAVHALEHGAVWISYQPTLDATAIEDMKKHVKGGYIFMSPLAEQTSPIVLSSWGTQLSLASATDARIAQFIGKYRLGPGTPEPGATCQANPAGMQR